VPLAGGAALVSRQKSVEVSVKHLTMMALMEILCSCRLARIRALVDRCQSQQPHQTLHPLAVDVMALGWTDYRDGGRSGERKRDPLDLT
jgi:hypothetical protein